MPHRRFRIVVCRGPECGDKRDSQAVQEAFVHAIAAAGAGDRCQLEWQSCFGRCSQGPNVLVREVPPAQPAAARPRFALADLPASRGGGPRLATALYNHVLPVNAAEVVDSHVLRGVVVTRLVERLPSLTDTGARAATARPSDATNDDRDPIPREAVPDVPTP